MFRILFAAIVLLIFTAPEAGAADPVPGDSCATYGANQFTQGGPSASAVENMMFCDGTNWQGITALSLSGGAIFSVGNTSGAAAPVSSGITLATTVDSTAQGASIALATLVTPAANNFYRVSCYVVLTRAATTSSTMPACNFAYTDESNTAHAAAALTSTSAANTKGTNSSGTAVLYAISGVAIQYSTSGFASSGGTSMQYAVHVRLEQL